MLKISISFLCLFILVTPIFSELPTSKIKYNQKIRVLINDALDKKLDQSLTWHKLLHYEKRSLFFLPKRSAINSSDFFLSDRGRYSPKQELIATIKAFYHTELKGDDHPQCRFPARYIWLEKELNWQVPKEDRQTCPKFKKWNRYGHIQSISLVFVTGYLSNPASFYGHLLVKFNAPTLGQNNNLLNSTVNYGAIFPNNEPSLFYIFRGLFGGYNATYSSKSFYHFNHNYTENQLRSLWEYPLNLSKEDVQFLVAHAYEVSGKYITYYFVKDNCAYRIADLLELVVPHPLAYKNLPWAVPATAYHSLHKATYSGEPAIREGTHIPSRLKRFHHKYNQLSLHEQQWIQRLSQSLTPLSNDFFKNETKETQQRIIETLLDYYEFLLIKDKQNKNLKQIKHTLLLTRLRYPSGAYPWGSKKETEPLLGQRPSMLQTSLVLNSTNDLSSILRIRAAYYDVLSRDIAQTPFSHSSMFDLKIRYNNSTVMLDELDFIRLEIYQPKYTPLTGDKGQTFKIRVGIENETFDCDHCQVTLIEGGYGKSLALGKKGVLYGMLEARIQTKKHYGTFSIMPKIGSIYTLSNRWKHHLSIGVRDHIDTNHKSQLLSEWAIRYTLSQQTDLQFSVRHLDTTQYRLSTSLYF